MLIRGICFCFAVALRAVKRVGREEFVDGEVDAGKEFAWIVFTGANAFLVGQTVVVGWNQQLRVAFQLDDGELTEGHQNAAVCSVKQKLAGETLRDEVRYLVDTGVSLVVIADIDKLHTENNRINSLDDADGQICGRYCGRIEIVGQNSGAEDFGAALAAEKHDVFIENGNSRNFGGPVDKRVGFALNLVKISEGNGIIPSVEGDFINIYRNI